MKRIAVLLTTLCVCAALTASRSNAEVRRHLSDIFAIETFIVQNSAGRFTCGHSGSTWVPGKISGSNFLPLATQLKSLKTSAKNAKGSKRTKLLKKIKSLSTTIKLGKSACAGGPPSTGGGGNPSPTPTPASGGNFDMAGNVTSAGKSIFGIPSSLNGNIGAGRTLWQAQCSGCHGEKLGRTMSQYRGLISQSPMLFSSSEIPDGSLANLTAFLNRFRQ